MTDSALSNSSDETGRAQSEALRPQVPSASAATARAANAVQRALGRELINVNYSRDGRFRQDPARNPAPLPDLHPAARLPGLDPASDTARVIGVHLARGQNRLVWACREAIRAVERFLTG